MTKDADSFVERRLRFGIRKPPDWRFLPPAWSPVAHLKNRSDADAWIQYARLPFVSMLGSHDSQHHPYPTVNVSCRPGRVDDRFDYAHLLEQFIEFGCSQHENFEIVEQSSTAVVDGCRALYLRSRYLLALERDGEEYAALTLSRSYAIFGDMHVFSVGMTSSADEAYFREADFDLVIRSVQIGL